MSDDDLYKYNMSCRFMQKSGDVPKNFASGAGRIVR